MRWTDRVKRVKGLGVREENSSDRVMSEEEHTMNPDGDSETSAVRKEDL